MYPIPLVSEVDIEIGVGKLVPEALIIPNPLATNVYPPPFANCPNPRGVLPDSEPPDALVMDNEGSTPELGISVLRVRILVVLVDTPLPKLHPARTIPNPTAEPSRAIFRPRVPVLDVEANLSKFI